MPSRLIATVPVHLGCEQRFRRSEGSARAGRNRAAVSHTSSRGEGRGSFVLLLFRHEWVTRCASVAWSGRPCARRPVTSRQRGRSARRTVRLTGRARMAAWAGIRWRVCFWARDRNQCRRQVRTAFRAAGQRQTISQVGVRLFDRSKSDDQAARESDGSIWAADAVSPPGGRKRQRPSPAWAETAPAGSGRRKRLGRVPKAAPSKSNVGGRRSVYLNSIHPPTQRRRPWPNLTGLSTPIRTPLTVGALLDCVAELGAAAQGLVDKRALFDGDGGLGGSFRQSSGRCRYRFASSVWRADGALLRKVVADPTFHPLGGVKGRYRQARAFPRSLRCIGFAAWAVAGAE